MDPITQQTVLACAGAAGGAGGATYVDDVFSTFLYEGNGSTSHSINNGIDLSGEGGMVWFGRRDDGAYKPLFDTERGATKALYSNVNLAEDTASTDLTAFNSNGFTVAQGATVNANGGDYVSWTFRKAPGFFDVVTYTGNGSSTGDSQTISHNLGSTPGFVIIKRRLSGTGDWVCWHRSISTGQPRKYIELDSTNGTGTMGVDIWGTVSSTEFEVKHNGTVGDSYEINKNGETYVAYFFAHDDQSFGDDSDEAIIKCGSYTGAGANQQVDVGFEPQWLLIRGSSNGGDWSIYDSMRTGDNVLFAQTTGAETDVSNSKAIDILSDGFQLPSTEYGDLNSSGRTYIYIAIRRPHKPPTAGTDVFKAINYYSGSNKLTTGFPVDLQIINGRASGFTGYYVFDRLRGFSTNDTAGGKQLLAYYDNAQTSATDFPTYNDNTGVKPSSWLNNVSVTYHNFKRAPGFLDIVAYTGNGNGSRAIDHNLGVAPEMIITKNYSQSTRNWRVWHKDLNGGGSNAASYNLVLNEQDTQSSNSDIFGGSSNTLPTATQYTIGGNSNINENGEKHIAYLFASLDGISKVGTYSGSSNDVTVDCGFSGAPRYVIIKCLTRQEFFVVFDHARGIVSGDDPFFRYDFATAETNGDHIDPTSSGFVARGGQGDSFNAAGHTYVYLAIA